jgi:hypothetical protein
MVGKVKDSEVRSVRIFVAVRSVVFFKVRSVRFVIGVAALPIQKVGEQTEKRRDWQSKMCLSVGDFLTFQRQFTRN